MKKFYFKQAVMFGKHNFKEESSFADVRFENKKHHEVSELIESHPYFQKLLGCGLIVPSESMPSHGKQESIDERNKRLADKLSEIKEVKAIPESSEIEESPEGLPEPELDEAPEKPSKKKGKK